MPKHDPSIDRLTRSHKNTFTSVRLDRLVEFREDADWVSQALNSSSARLVLQWRGKSLLRRSDPDTPVVYLEPGALAADDSQTTMLGRDSRFCYFAKAVDDDQLDHVLAQNPGSEFLDLRRASIELHEKHAGILAYAKALLYWQYRNAFCGSCGAPTRVESAGHRLCCMRRSAASSSIQSAIIASLARAAAAACCSASQRWSRPGCGRCS